MYVEVDSFGTVKFGYILGFVHGSTRDQFAAFPLSEFTFFSGFIIFRAFPIFWRNAYLILVLVEKVNIPISFNIGFFELGKVDSDSEDHVFYINFCSKIS
jgi:hypothetical protein